MSSETIEELEGLLDGPLAAMAFPLLAEAHRRAGRPEQAERVAREGLRAAAPAPAGHIALALALLDQKREDEARAELEGLLGSATEHTIAGQAAASDAVERAALGSETAASPWAMAAASGLPDVEPTPLAEARTPSAELEPVTPIEPPAAGPFGPLPPPAPAEALVFGGNVDDDELDDAFSEAESERDQMLGADDVARAALAAVPEDDELEDEGLVEAAADPSSPFATETVAELLDRQGHGEDARQVRAALPRSPSIELAPIDPPEDTSYETDPAVGLAAPQPVPEFGEVEPAASPAPAEAAAPTSDPIPLETEPPAADESRTETASPAPRARRSQATLERWLDNLRRDRP